MGNPLKPEVHLLLRRRRWAGFLLGGLIAFSLLVLYLFPSDTSTSTPSLITQGWEKAQDSATSRIWQDGLHDFHQAPGCNFSSLDLHHPFEPVCMHRADLLDAMSGGGRIGWDEPYWTRGCDMQWFTTSQVCDILARFDHIYLVGDSMLRHLAQAMHVLLRADLVDGGRATWRDDEDPLDCRCSTVFNDPGCVWWSAINTVDLLDGDPDSVRCSHRPALLSWHPELNYPLEPGALSKVFSNVESKTKPSGRDVFILGHGIWNDLEVETSMSWFEQVEDSMIREMPAYFAPDIDFSLFPRLFITPSAQGEGKPDIFHGTQNNLRAMRHGREMRSYAMERGFEHLGFFNLTVQATSPDGTHASYQNNLVKAMMVLNWLNMLDPPKRSFPSPKVPSHLLPQAATTTTAISAAPWIQGPASTALPPSRRPNNTDLRPEKHPIDDLVANADLRQEETLSKQSTGLSEAASIYRQKRGRHPPPRFDRWYQWAEEHNVLMIEDFYDTLYDDIEPFWDVSPQLIRDFPQSWAEILSIRDGQILRWDDEPDNIAAWMDLYAGGFSQLPLEDIPDIDLAFNAQDEPKLFVPWETRHGHVEAASRRKAANRPTGIPTVTDFERRDILPTTRPPAAERTHYQWADFDEGKPLWIAARNACSPTSEARRVAVPVSEDYTRTPLFPDHFLDHMEAGYVANWSDAKSACANPHLRSLHGSFIAMQSWSVENPRPRQKAIITDMVPLLSGSKIHDINSEILIPPAMQWPSEADGTDFTFNFKESARVPWDDKENKVMWRGSASGGINNADNWTRFQRHRFLAMLNGSLVSEHQKVIDMPLPAHAPGGHPVLPHNFPMPNGSLYPLAALESYDPPTALKGWIDNNTDGAFIHLRCYPPVTWFSGNGADCSYDGAYFTVREIVPSTEQFRYRYQPDLDGASYSGRYRSLLSSNSLPIKATIYDEWHDSRLLPWKHFVPMDNTFMDWWGMMEYFVGFEDQVDGHDGTAKKIALEGSEWARQALRVEDMLAYVYRLILELARLQDERRDDMGWAADLH